MIQINRTNPLFQLIWLVLLMVAGAIVGSIISYLIGISVWGQDSMTNPDLLMNNIGFLRLLQIMNVFFMMFAPSLIFLYHFGNERDYAQFKTPDNLLLFLISGLIIIVSQPFVEWTALINQKLELPNALHFIENWIVSNEQELNQVTLEFLDTKHWPVILINIAMMVFLPAICEEILFRGILQSKLTQWMGNGHLAVITTAIIFSAFHIQFLTFLPRFILGIALGYMLFWGKSILLPITGHLINNGIALTTFYYYRFNYPEINPLEMNMENSMPPYIYVISFVALMAAMIGMKKLAEKSSFIR